MNKRNKRYLENNINKKIEEVNSLLNKKIISDDIEVNIMAIQKLFENDDSLIIRNFTNINNNTKFFIIYSNGMVNTKVINDNIITPLMIIDNKDKVNIVDNIINKVLLADDIKKVRTLKEVIEVVTYGDTVLFIEGSNVAIIINTKNFKIRSLEEPVSERSLLGPREGFNESFIVNLSLIKRRLRTNELKAKFMSIGKQSNTQICICYMNNIVDPKILDQVYEKLNKINIDGIIDSNYLDELLSDNKYSIFKSIGKSEKPDYIATKLLEGKIAIIVDGSPVVLTIPYLFIENFQTSEDYYINFYYASIQRIIRIIGFIFAIITPALYICVVAFHHELLPPQLFIHFLLERQSVPLPAIIEVIILLVAFDILKEAGIRMPSNIGQALSIVGALVIGQAAVEAKLVAAPMIIVVALTGITSLLVPKLNTATLIVRNFLLIIASLFGFFGLVVGINILLIHIFNLKSFGIYQIDFANIFSKKTDKNSIFRFPWNKQKYRNSTITDNVTKLSIGGNS
ncbi:MAG TPA: spore germination protein [Tenericutes bacterium]|nr:spore germination protein [Mycoplasmatota bacterium]